MTPAQRFTLVAAAALGAAALAGCSAKNAPPKDANLVNGKQLFVQRCGSCHTLARAGTKGTQGPNLDAAFTQPLRDGFGRSAVQGLVRQQIDIPSQPDGREVQMPPDLVTGRDAEDVAAYVAQSAARRGKDEGLLASAVKSSASAKPAVAQDGTLTIPADPGGQLAFVNATAQAPAGRLTIEMPNKSGVPHNIAIQGKGAGKIVANGVSSFTATFAPGTYAYYCEVAGHREAGMEGKLTVR